MVYSAGGSDILQIHPGAVAGFIHQLQEGINVVPVQGFDLMFHTVIFLIDMERTQDCAVRYFIAKLRNLLDKILLGNLPQVITAEAAAKLRQLPGDCSILVGEVSMIGAAIDDADTIAIFGQVHIKLQNLRLSGIGKVDIDHAAHRGCHLVHQAAGLAKVDILGILTDLSDLDGRKLVLKEQVVENGSEEDLEGCGAAQSGTGQNIGSDLGIKALELGTVIPEGGSHAANQCRSRTKLFGPDGEIIQVNLECRIALGLNIDTIGTIEPNLCSGFQIHSRCQNTAMLMVGVITADFSSARGRVYIAFFHSDFSFVCFGIFICGQPGSAGWPSPHSAWSAGK